MAKTKKSALSSAVQSDFLKTLKNRFEKNMNRHAGLDWKKVQEKLESNPDKLWSLHEMEISGGEPDVFLIENKNKALLFMDCVAESPKERRSLCYDQSAWQSRKEHKPAGSAMGKAEEMGVELLDEELYRFLQKFGQFDSKTSSWLKTPAEIRKLGGAVFGDYRYGQVFVYHNGAESYYASRGFRTALWI